MLAQKTPVRLANPRLSKIALKSSGFGQINNDKHSYLHVTSPSTNCLQAAHFVPNWD